MAQEWAWTHNRRVIVLRKNIKPTMADHRELAPLNQMNVAWYFDMFYLSDYDYTYSLVILNIVQ